MVMLSTRLTGSSTSITVVSRRSAFSTGSSAPGALKLAATKAALASTPCHCGFTVARYSS